MQQVLQNLERIPLQKLPLRFQGELRDYQEQGFSWLRFLRQQDLGGGLLADDMGLGKTVQAIASIEGSALVIAPTSVIYNWQKELKRFRPDLSTSLYHGPKREFSCEVDVVITTYAIARLDLSKLKTVVWDTVILDEAQNIKNPSSQSARAIFQLQSKFRIALTGTPIENRLEDLWSQMHFLNPGFLGHRESFQRQYIRGINAGDEKLSERLRRRVAPFMLRRKKTEVLRELPARTDVTLFCELDESERGLYNSIMAATRDDIMQAIGAKGVPTLKVLEVLLRLRQTSCHQGLLPGRELVQTSSKQRLLISLLRKCLDGGHRALVFSQWTSFLDRIQKACEGEDISFGRIDGSTRNRQEVVDQFQQDDGVSVLLLSLKAAGTGLNLTAADHVFIVDPWWNPAVEEQAADRAHRIGQDKPVVVHRLVAKDTVEERVLELQEKKRQLASNIVGGEGPSFLSREELVDLLD